MAAILDKPSIRQAALPITVKQYHRLTREGILSERTELLRGVITERMTKSPLHTYVVQLLVKWLESCLDANQYLRKEEPLTLSDSEPEPDIAVVQGTPGEYRTRHPATADLVIEVAVATVGLDREKADIYAQAGVPEYWVVIPEQRAVEIYRAPTAEGYGSCDRVSDTETHLRPDRVPEATIRLADVVG